MRPNTSVPYWDGGSQRGMTQLQRCKGNYQMLCLILEELMPWAEQCNFDYSCLEVNRYIHST